MHPDLPTRNRGINRGEGNTNKRASKRNKFEQTNKLESTNSDETNPSELQFANQKSDLAIELKTETVHLILRNQDLQFEIKIGKIELMH